MKEKKLQSKKRKTPPKIKKYGERTFRKFMGSYSIMHRPYFPPSVVLFFFGLILGMGSMALMQNGKQVISLHTGKQHYWFSLQRASNIEYFYYGIPGDKENSKLLRTFLVKTGIPGERPTPLPQKVGRNYWLIINKYSSSENPETAPYFLELNVPGIEQEPYGPVPYKECKGEQCNWILPGAFGLHGVNGDMTRLGKENPGSSGCIRHSDQDITMLYQLLEPQKEEIRYYISDI